MKNRESYVVHTRPNVSVFLDTSGRIQGSVENIQDDESAPRLLLCVTTAAEVYGDGGHHSIGTESQRRWLCD